MKKLTFLFLFISSIGFAQIDFVGAADKLNYEYGQLIGLSAKLINNGNEPDTLWFGSVSCQAEFYFNSFFSGDFRSCLTLTERLILPPNSFREYTWNIDPEITGFPNKNGEQEIIFQNYFHDNDDNYFTLYDTVYVNAPKYYGGQVLVYYNSANKDYVGNIKTDLNIELVDSSGSSNVQEVWQITGLSVDSLYEIYSQDSLISEFSCSREFDYESVTLTSINGQENLPSTFEVSEVYPNPFNPIARFTVKLAETSDVEINVFNSLGELSSKIYNGNLSANNKYIFEFDGSNKSSGIYFLSIRSKNSSAMKKMILLK